jgi:hypothetical protein
METPIKGTVVIAAGIVLACVVFLAPDMIANPGEIPSFIFKGVCTIALLIAGVALRHMEKLALSTFCISASAALAALLFFSGAIRLSELGLI